MSSQELDYISIKGFKSFASIEKLPLRAINVVIGPNGSGKSNFIGVFSFLHAIREGKLQDYVTRAGGAEKVLHFGSKVTKAIELHISFNSEVNQYKITLEPTEADELFPSAEWVYYWNKAGYPQGPYGTGVASNGKEAGISREFTQKVEIWVRKHLARWRVYHFHDTSSSSPMKKTCAIDDNDYLRVDGANLAAFLYLLQEEHKTEYSLIRRTIQRVTPFFDDFRLKPKKLNQSTIQLEWRHTNSDQFFDASSLSDGTLRFMALATLFLQPKEYRPSVILVDEPELGLHPFAITMLGSLIKMAAAKTQVIVGTQSPLLLDQFTPEDVLVAGRKDGATEFRRLETEKLAGWLEDYSLGQLWEKNEFGGRPAPE